MDVANAELISKAMAARLIGVCVKTVDLMIRDGRLRAIRTHGSRWPRLALREVLALIDGDDGREPVSS